MKDIIVLGLLAIIVTIGYVSSISIKRGYMALSPMTKEAIKWVFLLVMLISIYLAFSVHIGLGIQR